MQLNGESIEITVTNEFRFSVTCDHICMSCGSMNGCKTDVCQTPDIRPIRGSLRYVLNGRSVTREEAEFSLEAVGLLDYIKLNSDYESAAG